jgi:hypothetical protein
MPRQQMQAQIAEHIALARGDDRWDGTDQQIAAGIVRQVVDPFLAASDVQRELAAVRAAANRTIDGLQAENQTLRARLAEAQQQVVYPGTSGIATGLSIEVAV